MVHHIVLYKLKPEVGDADLEEMMMHTRTLLLRIPEVRSVKCGKRIATDNQWGFFVALDFENTQKLAVYQEDAIYLKFLEEVVKPNTIHQLALEYEAEPGKDVRYS